MVYLFTALYCEAQIFIRQFNLTKNLENIWFQEFYNETLNLRLTITGVGELAAAAAVSSTCSMYRPTPSDLLLNVGMCAHTAKKDGIFLCNQIIELATGKTFYPDLLYRHPFRESAIVTGMLPWNAGQDGGRFGGQAPFAADLLPSNTQTDERMIAAGALAGMLYDMEAAAIYQAGIHFFAPHQMIFLKVVSDNGNAAEVSKEQVTSLMQNYQDCIIDYLMQTAAITKEHSDHNNEMNEKDKQIVETFCTDLHCSKAMRDSMRQYIRYMALSGMDYIGMIRELYEKNLLPCKDKKEGKQRFEEFKRRLF
ncbi:hypothetical protein C804_03185 [Lachnospiraceae bacterium A4]|nr:hypothetical protein C804_03185 [Lachnospiraceae bacterium A4]